MIQSQQRFYLLAKIEESLSELSLLFSETIDAVINGIVGQAPLLGINCNYSQLQELPKTGSPVLMSWQCAVVREPRSESLTGPLYSITHSEKRRKIQMILCCIKMARYSCSRLV